MFRINRSSFRTTVLIAFAAVMVSCAGSRRAQQSVKLADMYNPGANSVHPEVKVFHLNDSLSELNVQIYPQEIQFSIDNPDSTLQGMVRFEAELYNVKDSSVVVDTVSLRLTLDQQSLRKPSIQQKLILHAKYTECYVLKFTVTDVLRERVAVVLQMVDKTNRNTSQWYKTTNIDGSTFFGMAVRNGASLVLTHPTKNLDSAFVFYYKQLPVSPSPVVAVRALLPPSADSVWVWKVKDRKLSFPYEGSYLICADSLPGKGLVLGQFHNGFPKRITSCQLLESMVYIEPGVVDSNFICSNCKLTLDSLWLSRTGNQEASRELIRIYYNRLFLSNYFFSSYKEGWKTDRGMVFMVYGLPNQIFRYGLNEVWVYGKMSGKKSTRFHFRYQTGSASPNDFVMDYRRSSNLKWRTITDGWKNGKPFIYEEEEDEEGAE